MNLVSVITPCYNAAGLLPETIASVAAQTYPHIEHIVIDDGSTDGSWDIIQRYAASLTALELHQNQGVSYARNRGAALARGKFLLFLDADDLLAPDTIEALVSAAREQPGCIVVCECRRWVRQADGTWADVPRERLVPDSSTDLFAAFLTMSAWPPPCCMLWPREAYELIGGWDEELARDEDTDILLRAYALGVRIVRARQGVGYYRHIEGARVSLSTGVSLKRYRASIRVLDKLSAELNRLGRHHEYRDLLSLAYHRRALFGFRAGFWEAARESLQKGQLLGRHAVSTIPVARALEQLLGMEHKERLVQFVANLGIATKGRQELLRRKRLSGSNA